MDNSLLLLQLIKNGELAGSQNEIIIDDDPSLIEAIDHIIWKQTDYYEERTEGIYEFEANSSNSGTTPFLFNSKLLVVLGQIYAKFTTCSSAKELSKLNDTKIKIIDNDIVMTLDNFIYCYDNPHWDNTNRVLECTLKFRRSGVYELAGQLDVVLVYKEQWNYPEDGEATLAAKIIRINTKNGVFAVTWEAQPK